MRKPASILLFALVALAPADKERPNAIFEASLLAGRDAIAKQRWDDAAIVIQRALERDSKSPEAWGLRAAWGEGVGDLDEQVFALHQQLGLLIAQKAPRKQVDEIKTKLVALDPVAADLFKLRDGFIDQLEPVAEQYEKEGRPHSAIRVFQEILALDPESEKAQTAIERISELPDPTLADTAKPKDLMADVSEAWIRDHDEKHREWAARAKIEREHYITTTDAGYEVAVRSAEAMEHMNAFYRQFFFGEKGKDRAVGRIELHIFKNRDEYLKLGQGPPVEWSGGQFTGSAVETYIGDGGFEECVTTLFHEAAHQFVSLATSAAGWLNEGLASFFEGCRLLANGTVLMNMPANHRLFPLVARMNKGWMADANDGISASNASQEPETAPTFRIVLENKYAWGPPWYAPTWGVVFFLYNYQDPADGRFIYRKAFMEFIDASSGRSGEGAIENFEKVVLDNPQRPSPGLPSTERLKLVKHVDELNDVWFEWMVALADEQAGKSDVERPYLQWARYALKRNEPIVATEHFEKGVVAEPGNVELLAEFADHLAAREQNSDRATKLVLQALRVAENSEPVDARRVKELEAQLARFDPKRATLDSIHERLWKKATAIVERYMESKLPMMAMQVSSRLGTDLNAPGMFSLFEKAARESKKSIQLWQLAYNEMNLDGWGGADKKVWTPYGAELWAMFGDYSPSDYRFQFLSYDKITSGDFSMEMEVLAERGHSNFCGLLFGKKSATTSHALVLFPGHDADPATGRIERQGDLQLTSFFGGAVPPAPPFSLKVDTKTRGWHKMRLDVSGSIADAWWDGTYVGSRDFGSIDVTRGGFGLVIGPGDAKFRNVRYLARNPRDPGAAIERAMRMEKLEKDSGGGSIGGSWMNKKPPFPVVGHWAQGSRSAFDEHGPVPQLLVFWSMPQNDVLPIDKWLTDLAKRHADVGLDVISIAQFNSAPDELDAYLAKHPFPGAVGIDWKDPGRAGGGTSFEAYSIARFQMPRLVLLDVDGKVYWEGYPGMEAGKEWKPGMDTFLDESLRELVKRRNLTDLGRWRRAWEATGGPALMRGDLKAAFPLLDKSRELPAQKVVMVAQAQGWLRALESALTSGDATAASFTERGCEPAGKVLLEWAEIIGKPPEGKAKSALAHLATAPNTVEWSKAVKAIEKARADAKKGNVYEIARALATELKEMKGKFPGDVAADLLRAANGRDEAGVKRILAEADRQPAMWLTWEFAGP